MKTILLLILSGALYAQAPLPSPSNGAGGGGGGTCTGCVLGSANLVTAGKPVAVSSSGTVTQAVAANIVGLWGGTCNSTTVLGGDGNCQSQTGYVLGAANLTTTGAVPFQNGTTGTLTQDAAFMYSTGGSTLQVGRVSTGITGVSGYLEVFNQTPALRLHIGIQGSQYGALLGSGGIFAWASGSDPTGTLDTGLTRLGAGIVAFGTGANSSTAGSFEAIAGAFLPVATASLKTCTAATGVPWRASVNDATAPALGVVLTGGGAIFANVHCSQTTGTYLVDGL